MKLKARIVFEWEYEGNPENYGTDNPREAARIDTEGAERDIYLFLDGCPVVNLR